MPTPNNYQNHTNPQKQHKNGHWAQNQASAMTIPVLWPEPCRKISEVNWREEAPSWSCDLKDLEVILDEGMVSDLLSGVMPHQTL